MSAVADLVAAARGLLVEAEEWDRESTGNGGRTPRLLVERAGVLGNLAVATALAEQMAQSATTAEAVTQAREALTEVAGKVATLEALVPALQATATAATPRLAELGGRQAELSSGLAQVRTDLTTLARQMPPQTSTASAAVKVT